ACGDDDSRIHPQRPRSDLTGLDLFNDGCWAKLTSCLSKSKRAGIVDRHLARIILVLFPKTAKDHLPGSRLQNARHRDVRRFSYETAGIVHNDHCSVVEIGDTLVVFFAFFKDEHAHGFTWKNHRFESICKLVDVKDRNTPKL